jgi:hypothetical protein
MPTLKEIAERILAANGDFNDFRREAEKHDRLYRNMARPEEHTIHGYQANYNTKMSQTSRKNLKALARSSKNFSDFHKRANEE